MEKELSEVREKYNQELSEKADLIEEVLRKQNELSQLNSDFE
jgi:predicted nuclease with TOPRIM domain